MAQQDIHPESVTVTFTLCFERVERANPAAADLLRLCAFLAPDDIPEDLIMRCRSALPPGLQPVAVTPVLFDEALAIIRRYSLMQRLAARKSLSIHRVVQAVIQGDLEEKQQREDWEAAAVAGIAEVFSRAGYHDLLEEYKPYIPHALVCASLIHEKNFVNASIGHLLFLMGYYLTSCAQYEQAEVLCQKALKLYRKVFGPVHPEMAPILTNLALLYKEKRLHGKAQPLFEEVLTILEKAQPPDPSSLGSALSNLSQCYWFQGNYAESEKLGLQAVGILEQSAASKSSVFAATLLHLATIYRERGKLQQAEQQYLRALSIYESLLPPDHPAIAACLEAFATNTMLQGKLVLAESRYQKALSIFETAWGAEHPDVAGCLCRLADIYMAQGKFDHVEELNRRALAVYQRFGGPEYLEMNQPLLGLAAFYQFVRGEKAKAEELYKQAIALIEKSQGPEHSDLVAALTGYAGLLSSQGKIGDAKKLKTRANAIERKLLGQPSMEKDKSS